MKYRNNRMCLAIIALTFGVASFGPVQAGYDSAEESALREQLEQATKQLEAAASKLAELQIRKYGDPSAKRAMLGVLLSDMHQSNGVEIVGTTPQGGAAAAGLEAGDVLVKIGDVSLEQAGDANRALGEFLKTLAPGDAVEVEFLRGKQRRTVTVTTQARAAHIMSQLEGLKDLDIELDLLADHPALVKTLNVESLAGARFSRPAMIGLTKELADIFSVDGGVLIVEPPQDSPLVSGDVVTHVAGQAVSGIDDVAKHVRGAEGQPVTITVKRKGKRDEMTISPDNLAARYGVTARAIVMDPAGCAEGDIDEAKKD